MPKEVYPKGHTDSFDYAIAWIPSVGNPLH